MFDSFSFVNTWLGVIPSLKLAAGISDRETSGTRSRLIIVKTMVMLKYYTRTLNGSGNTKCLLTECEVCKGKYIFA